MTKRIRYASENGYSGELYGLRSLSIRDKDGKEVLHTGSRSIETYEELAEMVEGFPEFLETLMEATEKAGREGMNGAED